MGYVAHEIEEFWHFGLLLDGFAEIGGQMLICEFVKLGVAGL